MIGHLHIGLPLWVSNRALRVEQQQEIMRRRVALPVLVVVLALVCPTLQQHEDDVRVTKVLMAFSTEVQIESKR